MNTTQLEQPIPLSLNLFQDWSANRGNFKGRIILFFFRLAVFIRRTPGLSVIFFLYLITYRLIIEWFLNIELHWNVRVGKGLRLEHGHATVVNGSAIIGSNCVIRHLTTIGNKQLKDGSFSLAPQLGNNVDIGANVSIIGAIVIGDNVIIGTGAVVTKSVPAGCTIVGNPARILHRSTEY